MSPIPDLVYELNKLLSAAKSAKGPEGRLEFIDVVNAARDLRMQTKEETTRWIVSAKISKADAKVRTEQIYEFYLFVSEIHQNQMARANRPL